MSTASIQKPWLVRNQYRMRFSAITLLFIASSLDMFDKNRSLADWLLLGLVMLTYPHIQYWRTCRSANALHSELSHLKFDAFVVGILMAATGFSPWISFAAMLGTLMDNVTNKGWVTMPETCLGFIAGALAWVALRGFSFSMDSGLPVTFFVAIGLSGYLLVMSNNGYRRHTQLRTARESLKSREAQLLVANETLKDKLKENSDLQRQLLDLATHDPLTGLHNRRYLDSALDTHMARSKREASPLAFIMIDIDYFKQFNDHYGHQAGDECLVRVASTLGASIRRSSDLIARYGGEEFMVILPNTTPATAQDLAEEIRRSIESLEIPHGHSSFGKITISLGLAVKVNNTGGDAVALLHAADDALYQAKSSGRNQVRIAEETCNS